MHTHMHVHTCMRMCMCMRMRMCMCPGAPDGGSTAGSVGRRHVRAQPAPKRPPERACGAGGGKGGGGGAAKKATKEAPQLGGTVRRNGMVFRMMLDSKVAAEARLMEKVNEFTRHETTLRKLTEAEQGGDLDELVIVDHKSHVEQIEGAAHLHPGRRAERRARILGRRLEAVAAGLRRERRRALRVGARGAGQRAVDHL